MTYQPQVMLDRNSRPVLVYSKGRIKYHAVLADSKIRLVELESLRGFAHAMRRGEPYPPKRAASFWLNHDHREITKRAKDVLRELVARRADG